MWMELIRKEYVDLVAMMIGWRMSNVMRDISYLLGKVHVIYVVGRVHTTSNLGRLHHFAQQSLRGVVRNVTINRRLEERCWHNQRHQALLCLHLLIATDGRGESRATILIGSVDGCWAKRKRWLSRNLSWRLAYVRESLGLLAKRPILLNLVQPSECGGSRTAKVSIGKYSLGNQVQVLLRMKYKIVWKTTGMVDVRLTNTPNKGEFQTIGDQTTELWLRGGCHISTSRHTYVVS